MAPWILPMVTEWIKAETNSDPNTRRSGWPRQVEKLQQQQQQQQQHQHKIILKKKHSCLHNLQLHIYNFLYVISFFFKKILENHTCIIYTYLHLPHIYRFQLYGLLKWPSNPLQLGHSIASNAKARNPRGFVRPVVHVDGRSYLLHLGAGSAFGS